MGWNSTKCDRKGRKTGEINFGESLSRIRGRPGGNSWSFFKGEEKGERRRETEQQILSSILPGVLNSARELNRKCMAERGRKGKRKFVHVRACPQSVVLARRMTRTFRFSFLTFLVFPNLLWRQKVQISSPKSKRTISCSDPLREQPASHSNCEHCERWRGRVINSPNRAFLDTRLSSSSFPFRVFASPNKKVEEQVGIAFWWGEFSKRSETKPNPNRLLLVQLQPEGRGGGRDDPDI